MLTGIEYLSRMPYKDQVLYLKNLSTHGSAGDDRETSIASYLMAQYTSFSAFIINSFIWGKTPEGHAYWNGIAARY